MKKYCAFLRGVNVNGISMKMVDVCKVFTEAGMNDVSSVLATGNILFSSEKKSSDLKEILEKAMAHHFKYDAFLFIKSENEINDIFEKNPFLKAEDKHIYVFVGVEKVEEILLEEFQNSEKTPEENGKTVGNTFYWQVTKGNTLDSSFGKVLGRKNLKDKMTSRNINTFEKILIKFKASKP